MKMFKSLFFALAVCSSCSLFSAFSVKPANAQEVQPAFPNLMYMVAEAAKPTREDVKFLDWWAKYFDAAKYREAKKNEIAIADLRDETLQKLKSVKGERLLYANLPVHLGKYDAEKEEFAIELPFVAEGVELRNRSYLRPSYLAYPDGFGVWNATLSDFHPGLYMPFSNVDQLTPGAALVYVPHGGDFQKADTVNHLRARIVGAAPWGRLHVPRGQAKDLLDWCSTFKLVLGKFVFKVVGDMQISSPQTGQTAILKTASQFRDATVDIEPVALFLWNAKWPKFKSGDVEYVDERIRNVTEREQDATRREKEMYHTFIGALGNATKPIREPELTSALGPIRVELDLKSKTQTSVTTEDSRGPAISKGSSAPAPKLDAPTLPPVDAPTTLQAPKIQPIPVKN